MKTVYEAKKELSRLYRHEEGFVGVGIGHLGNREAIRVYVADARFPLFKRLSEKAEFEGFPLDIQAVGQIETLPIKSY